MRAENQGLRARVLELTAANQLLLNALPRITDPQR